MMPTTGSTTVAVSAFIMASTSTNPTILAVLSRGGLQKALDICGRKPTLYIDLNGRHVSRNGKISVMTIYEPIDNTVCLIDIRVLGHKAFEARLGHHHSLKMILESPRITKVFFDVRNDADALYKHYNISLQGVCDIQLIELGARTGSKKYVSGLEKCINMDSSLSARQKVEWLRCREKVKAVGNPRFRSQDFEKYCAGQVIWLPELFQRYDGKLDPYWRLKVELATEDRLKMVKSAYYDPESAYKVRGPWLHDGSSGGFLSSGDNWDDIFHAVFPDDEEESELAERFSYLNCEADEHDCLTDMLNDLDCQDEKEE